MQKGIRAVLWGVFLSVLVYSLAQLWDIYNGYRQGVESYDTIAQYAVLEAPESVVETLPKITEEAVMETMPDISDWPQVDFEELSRINSDVVGWIFLEGTNINYPVVRGQDNEYYLDRLFDGTKNDSGCIFMDVGCAGDFSGKHSILYGHHMKDKSMFAVLPSYKDQNFYEGHSEMLLVTPDAYYRIRFFSGYVADTFANAWGLHFNDESFGNWLNEVQSRSCFEAKDFPDLEDQIVTLSTCTYDFASAKFVLHGYVTEHIDKR